MQSSNTLFVTLYRSSVDQIDWILFLDRFWISTNSQGRSLKLEAAGASPTAKVPHSSDAPDPQETRASRANTVPACTARLRGTCVRPYQRTFRLQKMGTRERHIRYSSA